MAARKTKNHVIKIFKLLGSVGERGVTRRKIAEDLDLNLTSVRHHILSLIDEGIVEQNGKLDVSYGGRQPELYRLTSAFRSTQYDVSGTPGPESRSNT